MRFFFGATGRTRTADLLITNQKLLYCSIQNSTEIAGFFGISDFSIWHYNEEAGSQKVVKLQKFFCFLHSYLVSQNIRKFDLCFLQHPALQCACIPLLSCVYLSAPAGTAPF